MALTPPKKAVKSGLLNLIKYAKKAEKIQIPVAIQMISLVKKRKLPENVRNIEITAAGATTANTTCGKEKLDLFTKSPHVDRTN